MTPEQARKIKDGIDFFDQHQMWAEFPKRYDPYAVYDLAEIVAGLRYEYAVQVEYTDGEAEYARSFLTATPSIRDAWWTDEPNEGLAAKWQENALCNARIVRRLAGEPEVAS